MAKNWTAAEAFQALMDGDKDARIELGKRFPLFATATAEEIIGAIPDYVTARKIEAQLAADVDDEVEEEAEEEEEVKPAKKTASKKAAKKVVEEDEDDEEEEQAQ